MAWIGLGAVAVVSMIAAGWFFGGDGGGQTDLTDGVAVAADETSDSAAEGDSSEVDPAQPADVTTTTLPPETSTPSTTAAVTTTEATTPPSTGPVATREELLGSYVAVLWSQVGAPPSAFDGGTELERQLAAYKSRFGDEVRGVDSDLFGSLRDGTIAVVYNGGFASAREAKEWCRESGFFGTQDCFGVVLSDEYTPDQQGEFIRVYDL